MTSLKDKTIVIKPGSQGLWPAENLCRIMMMSMVQNAATRRLEEMLPIL